MHFAELGKANRQIMMAANALLEDLNVAGAVHRLDRIQTIVRCFREKHVLAEFFQMPGLLPKMRVHELRRVHFLKARFRLTLPHVRNQRLKNLPTFWMPEDGARRLFLQMKQIELTTDLAM